MAAGGVLASRALGPLPPAEAASQAAGELTEPCGAPIMPEGWLCTTAWRVGAARGYARRYGRASSGPVHWQAQPPATSRPADVSEGRTESPGTEDKKLAVGRGFRW